MLCLTDNMIEYFCNKCGNKRDKKSKSSLCRKCSSIEVYKKRDLSSWHNGKLWSKEDVLYLKNNFKILNKNVLENKFNRPYKEIRKKAIRLGIIKRKYYQIKWNNEEIKILKNLYSEKGVIELSKILNKKYTSIYKKANSLGLKKSKEYLINKGKNGLFSIKNPVYNKNYQKKSIQSKKDGYKSGKIKISGIALKSHLGLTKLENHPNWLGGKSFEPYSLNFNNKFKRYIRKRDNQVCMICGIHREKLNKSLPIHHINYDKKLSIPQNCISLCNSCHMKTNYNRKYWIKFFHNLLSEKYSYKYKKQEVIIIA